MNLELLSDCELENRIELISVKERKTTVEFLYHLREFDNRRLYLELGYSSLFDYCTRKLKYSEGGACRRINAARALRNNPEVATLIVNGDITLSSLSTASKCIKENKTTIQEIVGKSQREVERVVSSLTPVVKPKEVVKPLTITQPSISLNLETKAPEEERYHLKFSVSKKVYERLNQAKEKLSNSISELSLEALFEKLLDNYLDKKTRLKAPVNVDTRYIPSSVKNTVYKRDNGQCTYVAPDGTRCCQRLYLQMDHIDPYSLGGKSTVENLRLLCSAHHQHESRNFLG